MINFFLFLIPAVTGFLIAVLGPINSSLQARSGFWGMGIVVHVIGLAMSGIGYVVARSSNPVFYSNENIQHVTIIAVTAFAIALSYFAIASGTRNGLQPYSYFGGVIGLLIVMGTVYSIDKHGVLVAIAIIMVFEVIAGSLIDHHGFFGVEKVPLSRPRMASLVLLIVGILIGLKSK